MKQSETQSPKKKKIRDKTNKILDKNKTNSQEYQNPSHLFLILNKGTKCPERQ
jgi:hypothetical protein